MAEASVPPVVVWICGMISSRREWLDQAAGALAQAFGPVDIAGEIMDFDFTHYYDRQMGSPLLRQFVSFRDAPPPDTLVEAKLRTNAIEADFAARYGQADLPRPVNLDVGYVESSKLILASMKNFSHRIYLGRGVYAEVTMLFRRGQWERLAWTFPDFRSGRYDAFLSAACDRAAARAEKETRG